MSDDDLQFLRTKLKTGEYDGLDIMRAWIAIDELLLLRKDGDAYREIDQLRRMLEIARHERDHSRARYDKAVELLMGIHSLLYPAPITMADGRVMAFRPKDPDPHTILQELSDRIRALPDKIEKAC